ncbi:HAMP domain-containing histidine kinase [Ruminococcus sp. OA3]|uniref:sensor histidine kinase n=1 Tax=Ruminococcus sp. OA3 TaxID=2914164 RepID=UPI001F056D5E|nr:HAMP domain-containing sensor histidine kinase [Ruminococcus sp. OA3]MCH1983263.1 HAMP domain-containing histidine kinase [Ruminococcus sp. OA3]
MLKKLSLRVRLTLLSALVTAGMAVALTVVFLVSADLIFVQQLPKDLIDVSQTDADAHNTFTVKERRASVTDEKPGDAENQTGTSYSVEVSLSRASQQFNLWGILGLVLVIVLGTGTAWLMAGRALKPVQDLSSAIREVSGGDLSLRVDTDGRQDEIGQLSHSFNEMMDKVTESFERQKRFSANAAHELRTPLTTIQVGLEVLELEEQPSRPQMEKVLAVTRTNTSRMICLVEDLFHLSADESYVLDEEVSIDDLFGEIITELSHLIEDKRLMITSKISYGMKLKGSSTMLYRAMFNLVENAVKYSRNGGTISIASWEEEDTVVIHIADNGIGIAEDDLKHIFEPFYRVDRSRSRATGGSGLGLPLVKDIILRHEGSIEVESILDKGTSVTLQFNK